MKRLRCSVLCSALFILIAAPPAAAQDMLKLVDPATIESRTVGGKTVTRVFGNVHYYIVERDLHIYCDTSDYYPDEARYVLTGNVKIADPEKALFSDMMFYLNDSKEAYSPGRITVKQFTHNRKLTAQSGSYFYTEKRLYAEGNAIYTDSLRTVYADRVEYFENEDKVFAEGRVRVIDHGNSAAATADSAKYYQQRSYSILAGNPRIAVADTAGSDSLYITGLTIEYFGGDSARFVVTDSAAIQKGALTAKSRVAIYDRAASKIYLRDRPAIIHKSTEVYGRLIDLFVKDNTITEVVASDSATALMQADSSGRYELKNILSGKTIHIYLENESITQVIATRNAASTYYNFTEEHKLNGASYDSAEQIILTFENGELVWISISQDNMKYVPRHLLTKIRKRNNER